MITLLLAFASYVQPVPIAAPPASEQLDLPCPDMEIILHPYLVAHPEEVPLIDKVIIAQGCTKNYGAESRCPLVAIIAATGHIGVVCGAPSGIDDPELLKMLDELRKLSKGEVTK